MNGQDRVGNLTIDEIRRIRAEQLPTAVIADRAGLSTSTIKNLLRDLGLAYPRGGARPGSGPRGSRIAALDSRW